MSQKVVLGLKQTIMRATQARQYDAALEAARKLVALVPTDIEAWYVLAQLQERQGHIEDAVRSLYQACQGPSPVYAAAVQKAVALCKQFGLHQLGIAPAEALLKMKPNDAEVHFDLGKFWFELMCFTRASEYFLKALELDPKKEVYARFASLACSSKGAAEEGLRVIDSYVSTYGFSNETATINAITSNYPFDLSEEEVFDIHRRSGHYFESCNEQPYDYSGYQPGPKIRIGYLSPDFCKHSVAFFCKVLIDAHNRDRFEVICFSDVKKADDVTDLLQQKSDGWVECSQLNDDQVAEAIRAENIDILVDLMGYAGLSRMGVFARRAAPVQVTYLGYPNTSGLTRMDYRITDELSDPTGVTDPFYTEKLKRLAGGFLCYSAFDPAPDISELPAASAAGVCFGSFNNFLKISDNLIHLWASILKRLDNSTLFMKTKPLVDEVLKERVWQIFESEGVDRARLRLQGWTADMSSHLDLYRQVDIHLDSYPYNGTTTTVEALRQGVPTITLAGNSHRSRVGLSLMAQVGLEDWVAHSEEEYVEKAVALAGNLDYLRDLRKHLRVRIDASSLMDQERFMAEIESAYEEMIIERVKVLNE